LAFEAAQEAASIAEFQDFHCVSDPPIPASAESVVGRLAELNRRNALVVLIIDEALLAADTARRAALLEQILGADRWQGTVAIVSAPAELVASPILPHLGPSGGQRPTVLLSRNKAGMFATLRSVLIQERGRILQQTAPASGGETLPRLSAVKGQ
jgi:hypothetical protein